MDLLCYRTRHIVHRQWAWSIMRNAIVLINHEECIVVPYTSSDQKTSKECRTYNIWRIHDWQRRTSAMQCLTSGFTQLYTAAFTSLGIFRYENTTFFCNIYARGIGVVPLMSKDYTRGIGVVPLARGTAAHERHMPLASGRCTWAAQNIYTICIFILIINKRKTQADHPSKPDEALMSLVTISISSMQPVPAPSQTKK